MLVARGVYSKCCTVNIQCSGRRLLASHVLWACSGSALTRLNKRHSFSAYVFFSSVLEITQSTSMSKRIVHPTIPKLAHLHRSHYKVFLVCCFVPRQPLRDLYIRELAARARALSSHCSWITRSFCVSSETHSASTFGTAHCFSFGFRFCIRLYSLCLVFVSALMRLPLDACDFYTSTTVRASQHSLSLTLHASSSSILILNTT